MKFVKQQYDFRISFSEVAKIKDFIRWLANINDNTPGDADNLTSWQEDFIYYLERAVVELELLMNAIDRSETRENSGISIITDDEE